MGTLPLWYERLELSSVQKTTVLQRVLSQERSCHSPELCMHSVIDSIVTYRAGSFHFNSSHPIRTTNRLANLSTRIHKHTGERFCSISEAPHCEQPFLPLCNRGVIPTTLQSRLCKTRSRWLTLCNERILPTWSSGQRCRAVPAPWLRDAETDC